MRTLPKKTYQIQAMESGDTKKRPNRTESIATVTQNAVTHCEGARNKIGVKQGGRTVGIALSYNFLVKATVLAKKKPICPEMTVNKLILSYAKR